MSATEAILKGQRRTQVTITTAVTRNTRFLGPSHQNKELREESDWEDTEWGSSDEEQFEKGFTREHDSDHGSVASDGADNYFDAEEARSGESA